MRIGILTGGGDVPGLNACIRAVTLSAEDLGWSVTGFRRGWAGVLAIDPGDPASIAEHSVVLDRARVRGIDRTGGTILHTSRTDPRTVGDGDQTEKVLETLDAMGIEALVTLGGDGTLRFSAHLSGQGFKVLSIPKTMDNDVYGTDYCIGFATAVSRSVEAIQALRTTVASHERIGIVELFGRRSGETALLSGFLAQVDRTLISECPVNIDRLAELVSVDLTDHPGRYAMLVVSEGSSIEGEDHADELSTVASKRRRAPISSRIAQQLDKRIKAGTVVQQLAYLMRSGVPDALDLMVSLAFGRQAIQLLSAGDHGRMLAVRGGRYADVPIGHLLEGSKLVDVDNLYDVHTYRARLQAITGMPMFLY